MALVQYLFEGGSEGVTLTNANSGSSASSVAGGTHVFAATAKAHGSLGFRATNASGAGTFRRYPFAGAATPTMFQFSGVVTLPASAPLQNASLAAFVNSGGVVRLSLGMTPDSGLRLTDVGSAHQAFLLPVGQVVWGSKLRVAIEAVGNSTTAAQVTARLYAETSPGNGNFSSPVGSAVNVSNWNMSTDNIVGVDVGITTSPGAVALSVGWDDLQLRDGPGAEIADYSTSNVAPIADAGSPLYVQAGETVTLNGATSSDPDGDTLSYSWSFLWPSVGAPPLTGATSATSSFTAGAVGSVYAIQLQVGDGTATDSDIVNVLVIPPTPSSGTNGELVWDGTTWK